MQNYESGTPCGDSQGESLSKGAFKLMNKVKKLVSILASLTVLMTCTQFVLPAFASVLTDRVLSKNGGFENNIEGWTPGGATCTWQEGGADGSKGCVKVDVINGFNDISQKVNLEIGKKYYITFKAKLTEQNNTGKSAPVTLLFSYDNKKTEYPIQTKYDLNHETWTKAEVIYSPKNEPDNYGGSAKMYIRVGPQPQNEYSFDYYLDDFYCVELNTRENLLVNNDFEYGTVGWNPGGCIVTSVDGGANGTEKAAKVTVDSGKVNNNVLFTQSVSLEHGRYYELSFWAKLEQGETNKGVVLMNHEATGKTENILSNISLGTEWKKIKLYYKYDNTSDTGTHRMLFRPSDDSAVTNYFFDEAAIRPVSDDEVILNSDFDYNTSMWNAQNAALAVSDDTYAGSGQSLKVEAQAGGSPAQNVSLKAGESYTVSFWAKSDAALSLIPKVGETALCEAIEVGTNWNRHTFLYTPEEDVTYQPFTFEAADGNAHTYYLDDVEFGKSKPKAEDISVTGNPLVGETISVDYTFDNAGLSDEGESRYRIRMADSIFYEELESGTTQSGKPVTLALTEQFENKRLVIDITPVDSNGVVGKMQTIALPRIKRAYEANISFDGTIEPNGAIKPLATIVNNTSEDKTITVVMAVYDANGTMRGVVADKQEAGQFGGKAEFVFQTPVTLTEDVTGYTAKIMIWEAPFGKTGITNMVSLLDSISYQNE